MSSFQGKNAAWLVNASVFSLVNGGAMARETLDRLGSDADRANAFLIEEHVRVIDRYYVQVHIISRAR